MYIHGQLAQSVEQRPEKPRVRSSILRLPTIFHFDFIGLVRLESRDNSDPSRIPLFSFDRIFDSEELFNHPQVCQEMICDARGGKHGSTVCKGKIKHDLVGQVKVEAGMRRKIVQ